LAEFRNGVNYNKSSFGHGVKVVGVSDFQDYTKPRYDELEQINPEGIVTERNILCDGDIVFVRSNGNRELIGRSLFIEQPPEEVTHSAFTIRLRFTSREVHPKFYAYCFRTPLIRHGLTAQGGGTNINNLNQDILNALEVPLPPLPVQRRITGILSAYDELIENSQRRIRILEDMARALYREWFVNFRFPGHENIKLVDSPLGKIPKGWETAPLSSLVDFAKGRKPAETRSVPLPGDVKLLLIDSLHGGQPVFTSPTKLVLAEIRDTIMVMDGASSCEVTIGASGAVGSTLGRFRTTKPNIFSPHALNRFLEDKAEEFKSKNIGAAIPHANKDYILTQAVALPPEKIAASFYEQLEPIQCTIETLKIQIQNLRRTRDLLLPRLLSGQQKLL
jgi:type I restriction enzyme S subunit